MTHPAVAAAFAASINLGHLIRSAEESIEGTPDLDSARLHLIDIRGALGQIALHLAELHADDVEAQRPSTPTPNGHRIERQGTPDTMRPLCGAALVSFFRGRSHLCGAALGHGSVHRCFCCGAEFEVVR